MESGGYEFSSPILDMVTVDDTLVVYTTHGIYFAANATDPPVVLGAGRASPDAAGTLVRHDSP